MRRIVGIDVARGLAVLGMMTAHVGPDDHGPIPPGGFAQLADGRPAALFVVLAGAVARAALRRRGPGHRDPARRRHACASSCGRCCCSRSASCSSLLAHAGRRDPADVRRCCSRSAASRCAGRGAALLTAAGVVAVLGPPLGQTHRRRASRTRTDTTLAELTVGHYYPAIVWMAYLLRRARDRPQRPALRSAARHRRPGRRRARDPRARRLVGRAAPASAGPTELRPQRAALVDHVRGRRQRRRRAPRDRRLPRASPTAGRARPRPARGRRVARPHRVHRAHRRDRVLGQTVVYAARPSQVWLAFLLTTVALCWLWARSVGRGPLEWVLHRVSTRAADVAPDALPPRTTEPSAPSRPDSDQAHS